MTGAALECGRVFWRKYQVDRLLAAGATARLYLGHPMEGAGQVAIKHFCPSGDFSPEDLAIFRREYEILARLECPGIPRAIEFMSDGGEFFIVEEFVPGQTLEQAMARDDHFPPERAIRVVASVLDILACLHDHGIVFRDLKPSNVLVAPDGSVRLIDFGAARRWRRSAKHDTVALGTPGYAAPEQYGLAQTDARSDVYSAGALLHHLLTGIEPEGQNSWAPLGRGVPDHVRRAVMRALSIEPARRFKSASAMRKALLERPVQVRDRIAPPIGHSLLSFLMTGDALSILMKGNDTPATPPVGFGRLRKRFRVFSRRPVGRWVILENLCRHGVVAAALVACVLGAVCFGPEPVRSLARPSVPYLPIVIVSELAVLGTLDLTVFVDLFDNGFVLHLGPWSRKLAWNRLCRLCTCRSWYGKSTCFEAVEARLTLGPWWRCASIIAAAAVQHAGMIESEVGCTHHPAPHGKTLVRPGPLPPVASCGDR